MILDPALKNTLIIWFSKYSEENFSFILESLQTLVSITISTQLPTSSSQPFDYIRNLLLFSKFLYEANKLSNIKSIQDFYIENISKSFKPIDELRKWIINHMSFKNEFTFLDYPWILECSFKAKIIELESKTEMAKEIENILIDPISLLLSGGIDEIFLKIKVRRDRLIEDTLNQLKSTKINYKKQLRVRFINK